ncbi:hypothetical protein 8F11_18 [uncultured Caudovirales phage]|uniref:Uncharacterized protein n=1 Tax=uncultured Caudovirales phage TaxID=2100421 RepID=A0A2H4J2J0_9CAUD|nr:hypothetical protein 8F11_18 [uncultured Caudovirales phage]
MTKRIYLADKTYRKFMKYLAETYLEICIHRDHTDIDAGGYVYATNALAHKYHAKREKLEKLFEKDGADFSKAIKHIEGETVEFEDTDKGLRKILEKYYPESMRETIEKKYSSSKGFNYERK